MRMWLDDVRDPTTFGYNDWTWVRTAPDAIALLQTGLVIEASLDHDLGICQACKDIETWQATSYDQACPHTGTGYDVVCWMETHNVRPPKGVHVHSANIVGRHRMQLAIDRAYRRND